MKKAWYIVIAAILAILLVPIPGSPYRDGGTRAYTALTYKVVDWNRLSTDGVYESTEVYWFPDNFRSIDELWLDEEQKMVHRFTATVLELDSSSALVQPMPGEEAPYSSDLFRISLAELGDIGAEVGTVVDIYYTGGIMESYPAQVHAVKWEISGNQARSGGTSGR